MKKRLIFTKESPDTFKFGDTDSTLSMQLVDTTDDVNTPVDPSSFQSVKMVIRSKDYYLRDLTPAINKDSVTVSSSDLADLPAGSYFFEAWATTKDGKAEVYPDYGFLGFEITQNGYYQAGRELAGVAVDKLRDELHKYVDDRLAAQKPVDLSDYVKSEQLQDYAKKQDVPVVAYDSDKNTLSINGQSWQLQQKIDLSAYAKKSDIPVVGLDVKDRTLSINGIKIDIPAKVDLSSYVTSEQFNEAVQAFPIVTYDISTNDLEVNGQKVPLVSDQDVDNKLIGYAKKTDLPVLTLDTTKRTLNLNGVSINIPASVDLSGYAKTSEVPKVTYDQTNQKLTVDGVDVPLTGGQSEDLSKYIFSNSADKSFRTNIDLSKEYDQQYIDFFAHGNTSDVQSAIRSNSDNIFDLHHLVNYIGKTLLMMADIKLVKQRAKILFDYADSKIDIDSYFSFNGNQTDWGVNTDVLGIGLYQSDDNLKQYHTLIDPIYTEYLQKIDSATTVQSVITTTKEGLIKIDDLLDRGNINNSNFQTAKLWYHWGDNDRATVNFMPDDWTKWPVPDDYTLDKEAK